jgi:hypothetical protein
VETFSPRARCRHRRITHTSAAPSSLISYPYLTLHLTTADKQTAHNAGNRLDQRRLINLLGARCVRSDMVHCAAASTPLPGSLTS